MRLPTGREMPTLSPTRSVAQLMISGIVKRVMMLLSAVSVTERATSPPASFEKTLDELPPGQQAMRMSPMKKTGGRRNMLASPRAMAGNRTIWPNNATASGPGWRKTFPKSSTRRERPRSNISRVRMGRTIQMAMMLRFWAGKDSKKSRILSCRDGKSCVPVRRIAG